MQKKLLNIKIIMCFVLLIVISVIPVVLIKYQDRRLLNRANFTEYMPKSILGDEGDSYNNIKVTEKLLALIEATNNNAITKIEEKKEIDEEFEKLLISKIYKELMELQKVNAIPKFTLPEGGRVYELTKMKIYYKLSEYFWFEIWEIAVEYDDASIIVLMDAKTSSLYSIYFRIDSLIWDWRDVQIASYGKYLGFKDTNVVNKEDEKSNKNIDIQHKINMKMDGFFVTYIVEYGEDFLQYFPIDSRKT